MNYSLLLIGAVLALASAPVAGESPAGWYQDAQRLIAERRARHGDMPAARNVILFLGDGMSLATVNAARIMEGQLRGESGEENLLYFEKSPHLALAKTYNTDQQTPDSAGTISAIVKSAWTPARMALSRPRRQLI